MIDRRVKSVETREHVPTGVQFTPELLLSALACNRCLTNDGVMIDRRAQELKHESIFHVGTSNLFSEWT